MRGATTRAEAIYSAFSVSISLRRRRLYHKSLRSQLFKPDVFVEVAQIPFDIKQKCRRTNHARINILWSFVLHAFTRQNFVGLVEIRLPKIAICNLFVSKFHIFPKYGKILSYFVHDPQYHYPAFCSILSQKSVILLPDTGILTLPPSPTPFDPPNAGQAYLLYIKKEHPVGCSI